MITDRAQLALTKALDATALRNRAIANNIANVETPGYTRQDVDFEQQLRSALSGSAATGLSADGTIESVSPRVMVDRTQAVRENGNNVDVDHEMARLAENSVHYEALVQAFSMKDGMLRTAIYEGRK